ncbi:ATPase, T2SS/T4P/T4SS family [Ferrovibrio xuzhouensis]|uniref:ATPase, T2SS/T4P/T4SS family n=1 Tax=Ferrovibrio xuzhouensis TaxID=1576914 RepID=A0ABV7VFG5_9PROT
MGAVSTGTDVMLRRLLGPLSQHYSNDNTVEIRMVRPGVVTADRRGVGKRQEEAPSLTLAELETICKGLANYRGLKFDPDEHPKLSCILPDGHRFECLVGPSVQTGVSLAIRCKHPFTPSWEQIGVSPVIRDYLKDAVDRDLNIIVSGATNTGKTTLLNMMLEWVPADCRVVGIEDTPELKLERFWDGVPLIAAREAGTGAGMLDWRQLYDHLMRATPDRPIFGEISTQNAFAALAVLNAGMPGFMCSIHADSPEQAINRKFDQNIAWSGAVMPKVPEYLCELVDVVVQIKRHRDGWRRITDIYEPKRDRYVLRDSAPVLKLAE